MPTPPLADVRRLGAATFQTTDLARLADYYTEIIGLSPVDRTGSRVIFATAQGQEAIVLEQASKTGLKTLSLQLAPQTDLDDLARRLEAAGLRPRIVSDATPGMRKALQLVDPKGTVLELFSDYTFAPRNRGLHGLMPLKLGHVAFVAPELHRLVSFYTDLLGFRISDWRQDAAYFLRCNPDHHAVNFFADEAPRLHHIAFEMRDWSELHRACDFLARNGRLLEWGPSRHIVGHNIACYHRDPDGSLVELYTELDQMKDEALGFFEPRPWHEDTPQRPKAWPAGTSTNYWGTHQIRAEKRH